MNTYESLTDYERQAIENALDAFRDECRNLGIKLAGDDRAGHAAEALAVYLHKSKG